MAYGRGNKDTEKRMIMLSVGDLTDTKYDALLLLRSRYLELANQMVATGFCHEPLSGAPDKKALDALLTPIQKSVKNFNKAYAQKVQLDVVSALNEVHSRYLKRLKGKLRHCADEVDDYQGIGRRYLNIPEELQHAVTHEEIKALQAMASGWQASINLLRQVIIEKSTTDLTPGQVKVIQSLHHQVRESYRAPIYGADERFTCQIHLDYRVISGLDRDGKLLRQFNWATARLLEDKLNTHYQRFLEISHPVPRGPSIRIPLELSPKQIQRLNINGKDTAIKSFVIEIGHERITLKAVVEKAPEEHAKLQTTALKTPKNLDDDAFLELARFLNDTTHLIGRDYGYANTIALSVLKRQHALTPEDIEALMIIRHMPDKQAKQAMKEWFESRIGEEIEVAHQEVYSGRNFLKAISDHCAHIDRLKSAIDHHYHKIHAIRDIVSDYLDLGDDEKIPRQGAAIHDDFVKSLHQRFFQLIDKVNHLKAKRLDLYAKIRGLKKSWFGFLSNQEVRLAKRYNAAMIREDLTVMAIEKSSPENKGRLFNKMINNGSKGQYIRQASDKFLWNGILEVAVPSPYTSQACVFHSKLGKRKQEVFSCPSCDSARHSDSNAALNIAGMLLMRPAMSDK